MAQSTPTVFPAQLLVMPGKLIQTFSCQSGNYLPFFEQHNFSVMTHAHLVESFNRQSEMASIEKRR
jgi:hypothetical protein